MKKVFLDTNILLEVILDRQQRVACEQILQAGISGQIALYAAYLSFANMAYVMKKKKMRREDIYRAERFLNSIINVLPMDGQQLTAALAYEVKDFEDMLQYQCAENGECDCIVTINSTDFLEFSTMPINTPDELLDSIEETKQQ